MITTYLLGGAVGLLGALAVIGVLIERDLADLIELWRTPTRKAPGVVAGAARAETDASATRELLLPHDEHHISGPRPTVKTGGVR